MNAIYILRLLGSCDFHSSVRRNSQERGRINSVFGFVLFLFDWLFFGCCCFFLISKRNSNISFAIVAWMREVLDHSPG